MKNLKSIYNPKVSNYAESYYDYLKELFEKINFLEIESFVSEILNARNRGSNIFFIGNGGSAATATHFANDLAMGSKSISKPFKAISLCDNQAITTALGNDYGFESIFLKQLECYSNPNDLVVAISASGNSPNLVRAIEYGNKNQLITISITGFDGGILKNISRHNIHIQTDQGEYAPVEDVHMTLAGLTGSYFISLIDKENIS